MLGGIHQTTGSEAPWAHFTIEELGQSRQVSVRSGELLVCLKEAPGAWARERFPANSTWSWEPLVSGDRKHLRPKGAYRNKQPHLDQWVLVRLPDQAGLKNAIRQLRLDPNVLHVEPNLRIDIDQAEVELPLPNDFYFDRSWGLNNTGQFEGTVDADIDLPEAWELGIGSKEVVVAVVDTGIDFFHPDIRDNIWINTNEIPGNGLDDDNNGYIDDVHGYDFVSDDGDPFDDQSHGTHVAGIVGAVTNNRQGSAGVAQKVSMMAIKTFGVRGTADVATVARGVRYAIDHGARIINASWGVDVRSEIMRTLVEEAAEADVLFIAAGGNRQSNQLFYPAAFDHTIGVGATDRNDKRTRFSNFGPFIDLAAPGQTIFSTMPDNRFGFLSGTSMAAPHVTGAAVLVLARNPDWNSSDLTRMLLNAVDAIQPDKYIGSGRLNVLKAQQTIDRLPGAAFLLPDKLGGIVDIQGSANGERFRDYVLSVGPGPFPESWTVIHRSDQPVTDETLLAQFNTEDLADGIHTFRIEVTDTLGQINTVKKSVEVANVEIIFPQNNDILRAGDIIEIKGSAFGKSRAYSLEIGVGANPGEWMQLGIEQSETTDSTPFQEALATWDTGQVEPNSLYSLRLTATDAQGEVETHIVQAIHLEANLLPEFPIYHSIGKEATGDDWRPIVVEDLDQDGDQEIVLVEVGDLFGMPTILYVYHHDGTLAWQTTLGDAVPFQDLPLVGDLDGDGTMEIFTEGGSGGLLQGFHHDGTPMNDGWPVRTGYKSLGKVMADLNGDGTQEIIALGHESASGTFSNNRQLMVIQADGTISTRWNLLACDHDQDVMELLPAIANMDDDPELEIVCVNDCKSVGIYDLNDPGNVTINAFTTSGKLLTSPVIGDLDRDGTNEIIVVADGSETDTRGGIYAFYRNGSMLPNFPAIFEEHFDSAPALADLDGDEDLEIVVSSHRTRMLYAIHHHGFPLDNWPIGPVRDGLIRSTPVIADIDGDETLDILSPTYGSTFTLLSTGEYSRTTGLRAWNASGVPVLFGKGYEKDRLWIELPSGSLIKNAPPTITDLDGDGQLDVVSSTTVDIAYARDNPRIRLKNRHSIYAWSLNAPYRADLLPWPTYQKDNQRSGRFDESVRVNQPPEIRPILSQTIPLVGTFFPINLNRFGSDPDHAPNELLWTIEGNVNLGLELDDLNQLKLVPMEPAWTGTEVLTFRLTDPEGATDQLTASFSILEGYQPPLAATDQIETDEDHPIEINLLLNDEHPKGLPLSILELSPPLNGRAFKVGDGMVRYEPKENINGEDSFQYVIADEEGGMAIGEVLILIRPINDAPVVKEDRIVVVEDESVEFDPLENDKDPDEDPFTLVEWTEPTNGILTRLESGKFKYVPNPDFAGADAFTYVIQDSNGMLDEGDASLLVTGINDRPIALSQHFEMNRNREQNITFTADDPDGDPLSFEIIDGPEHGRVLAFPDVATYSPEFGYTGTDQFTYRANDGKTDGPIATVEFVIGDENNPPDVDDQYIITAVNQEVHIDLEAEDVDEDPFEFSIASHPESGTLNIAESTLSYLPTKDFVGKTEATLQAMDNLGATGTAQITFEVTDENTAPEARDIGVQIFGNKEESFELGIEDRENNPLTFEWLILPENGTISGEPPNLTYHPAPDFFGFDRLQFIANDGEFDSNPGTVVIEVQYPNHKPSGNNQSIKLQRNLPKTFLLDVEDIDEDTLNRVILEGPKHGVLSGLENELIYTPDRGYTGSDSFTWRVWDGFKYSNTGKVSIQVTRFDPDFRLEIESIGMIADQQLRIITNAEIGRRYTLQTSDDLRNWVDLETIRAEEDTITFIDGFDPLLSLRYYRAVAAP